MQIFVKKFFGFNPENIPVITFSQDGSRRTLLNKAKRGDIMVFVATAAGEHTLDDEQGKIIGMAEIGSDEVKTLDFVLDTNRLPKDYFELNGDFKWPYGIPMVRAWRFINPPHRLEILGGSVIDSQATRSNAVLLSDNDKEKILSLDKEEVILPVTKKMESIKTINDALSIEMDVEWKQEANRIAEGIFSRVKNSNGQTVERVVKIKSTDLSKGELELLIRKLLKDQNYRCALTKQKLKPHLKGGQGNWLAPSPDRIDSNGHYTKDNIQILSWAANMAKNDTAPEHVEGLFKALQIVDGEN